jgi:hypothetical protein
MTHTPLCDKAFVTVDAPAPFDFVETVGRRTELIRYADGSGNAIRSQEIGSSMCLIFQLLDKIVC